MVNPFVLGSFTSAPRHLSPVPRHIAPVHFLPAWDGAVCVGRIVDQAVELEKSYGKSLVS